MSTQPYASAKRVFWVVDNGSSHNGQASIDRMTTAWPTATLLHLPVHASWLNQVEINFSILQRKAISPNDFADLDALAERILAFQDRYNTAASPFDWTTPEQTSTPSYAASTTTTTPRSQAGPLDPRRTNGFAH